MARSGGEQETLRRESCAVDCVIIEEEQCAFPSRQPQGSCAQHRRRNIGVPDLGSVLLSSVGHANEASGIKLARAIVYRKSHNLTTMSEGPELLPPFARVVDQFRSWGSLSPALASTTWLRQVSLVKQHAVIPLICLSQGPSLRSSIPSLIGCMGRSECLASKAAGTGHQ